ncbi:hypothetical protein [Brevundimonas sp. LjRoot202]|uniref:hypothetical protein n=1 Tax=Brevundimonas sp. LjRoot202 TaxID=3342281 RepID=UPI003ECCAA96
MAKKLEAAPSGDEYPAEQGTIGSIPNEPDNGMPSHDDIRMAANEMVSWNEKRAALNAQISAFRKGLKAKGITLGVLDEQVRMLDWTPEEIKKHYAERDWFAEAMRYPIGSQLELYGTDATPDPVKEQLRWRNIGFKDGLAGRGWADQPPKECPHECHQSYGEGHEEGQATVRRAFEARLTAANLQPEDQTDLEDAANDAGDDSEHAQDAA